MSDIFISYAREDRALAEALANDLKARGYGVWWDTELVGSDDFQDVILAALANARAAIVIWTKASVKSLFVRDEARYALHYEKLVAVKAPDIAILDIPFGFQGQHTDDIGNRDQIIRAVTKLGVACASSASAVADTWEAVHDSRDVTALLEWLERNPTHDKRPEMFKRVRSLMEAADKAATTTQETPGAVARTSYLSAFFSGLTFRMPSFQLSAQGKWSAAGLAVGLVVALFVGTFASMALAAFVEELSLSLGFTRHFATAIGSVPFLLVQLLLYRFAIGRFDTFVTQRLFVGARILSPFIALCLAAGTFLVVAAFGQLVGLAGTIYWPGALVVGCASAIWAVAYMNRRVRSAR